MQALRYLAACFAISEHSLWTMNQLAHIFFHHLNFYSVIISSLSLPSTFWLPLLNTFSQRSLAFADFRQGQRLANSSIANENATSVFSCAMKCSKLPSCKSFNHCGKALCELNYKDIHDSQGHLELISDRLWADFGLPTGDFSATSGDFWILPLRNFSCADCSADWD